MQEIVDGVFTWSWFSEPRQMHFNGHYLPDPRGGVVVDPPPCAESDLEEMERRGRPRAILLTNVHHGRASRALAARFGCEVLIHAADAGGVDAPVSGTFGDGDALPGGLVAIHVPDSKSPGETAFHLPAARALLVGDALIGDPPGEVRLLPPEKFADVARAREGIRRLLQVSFEALMLGDGASIPRGGPGAVRRFLERTA